MIEESRPPERSFFQCVRAQARIVGALMLRETMHRYGHENIGFFWLMGEPLLLSLGVMIVWTLLDSTSGTGVGVVPFILTGYSMVMLWRHIVFRAMHCLRHNAGLLFHMNVRSFDTLLSRALLDTIGNLAAFFIAYVPLTLLGFMDPMHDPLIALGGWGLQAWLAFGVALNVAALTELVPPSEWFIHPIMYLILPISGTFFMVSWLPERYQQLALWSPLVNVNEMFRAGVFPSDVTTSWDAWYVVLWCVVLTAIGLPLIRIARNRVHLS